MLLLVGPVGWGDPSTEVSHLLSQPNVLMPGRADDADLAGIVASFDVAILPMADNESTRASFPMKFYEYMAAGRPIVARDLPSFAEYRDGPALCRLAATHDDFVAAVRAALDDAGDAAARVAEAEKHDWTARVETISEAVEKAVIDKPKAARVAIVHDWLTGMRGGEKVLEVMCELWPDADLFTLLHVPDRLSPSIERMRIRTSFVQDLPNAPSWYRYYLPFFPSAIESFDFSEYDLVISSSHCVAKGARVRPGATHVSYVHTPMRYVWDMYDEYFGPQRVKYAAIRAAIGVVAERLRRWDVRTVDRVTHYTCNSAYVAERIKRIYGRDARVIHPPVDIERFEPAETIGDYYLVLSAMAPYKRVDLAIEAAARGGFKLKVAGIGEDEKRMRAHAPANVEFLGWVSDDEKAELYAHCRAFIFPGEEDFGITPLEAQAAGRPVIAYAKGGALETVIGAYPGEKCPRDATGVFFREQTVEALIDAVRYCEEHMDRFDPEDLRRHAFGFGRQRFAGELRAFVELARR
ncbi:MAG: glycosyltransferase [Deltaproteobacteria bacterium]|nr:glycosyltransferase [Deltaproteobacteria bacterium]